MSENSAPKIDADVIIVGAGPAGMSAAADLAEAGCSVIVLDMQPAPGGQIYRAVEANVAGKTHLSDLLSALGPAYAAGIALVRRFRAAPLIDFRAQTTVWEVRPDGTVGWLRGSNAGYLRGHHVLLANGTMERPTPFPGWTLPGVMTAGAVQTLLKAGRLKPVGRVVLAGTGPLVLLLADQMRRLGVKPALIAQTDRLSNFVKAARFLRPDALLPLAKGIGWLARLRLANVKFVTGISRLEANGDGRVEVVSFSAKGRRFTYPCDLLIVHDGIVPSIDLALGAGLPLEWDTLNASWQPKTAIDGAAAAEGAGLEDHTCAIRVTGDARRIGGADVAVMHGKLAAAAILDEMRKAVPGAVPRAKWALNKAYAPRPFLDAAFPPGLSADPIGDSTIICRCEELSAGFLRAKIRAGAQEMNLLRGESRCGMGPCQGRNCMVTIARLIAENRSTSGPAPLPAFRSRPPARPLPLGALAHLTGLDPDAAKILTLDDKPKNSTWEADRAEQG